MTPKTSKKVTKKVRNIQKNQNVYFSVDDENYDEEHCPAKGVKGKGTVTLLEDLEKVVPIGEKPNLKYLRTLASIG